MFCIIISMIYTFQCYIFCFRKNCIKLNMLLILNLMVSDYLINNDSMYRNAKSFCFQRIKKVEKIDAL